MNVFSIQSTAIDSTPLDIMCNIVYDSMLIVLLYVTAAVDNLKNTIPIITHAS